MCLRHLRHMYYTAQPNIIPQERYPIEGGPPFPGSAGTPSKGRIPPSWSTTVLPPKGELHKKTSRWNGMFLFVPRLLLIVAWSNHRPSTE
jgi:hypothetical protein